MYILTYIQRLFLFYLLNTQFWRPFSFLSDAPSIGVPFLISLGTALLCLLFHPELSTLDVNGSTVSRLYDLLRSEVFVALAGIHRTSVMVLYTKRSFNVQKVLVAGEIHRLRNMHIHIWNSMPKAISLRNIVCQYPSLRQCIQEMQPKYIAHNG